MPALKPSRTRPPAPREPRLWVFLLVAVALHGAWGGLGLFWHGGAEPPPRASVEARTRAPHPAWTLSPHATRAAVEAARILQRREVAQEPKKKPVRGAVVDVPPSAHDRPPPDDAAFLAEHDARTDKQTRSRHASSTFEQAQHEPIAGRGKPRGRVPPQAAPEATPQEPLRARAGGSAASSPPQPPQQARAHKDRLQLPEQASRAGLRNQEAQMQADAKPLQLRLGPEGAPRGIGQGKGDAAGPGAGVHAAGPKVLSMAQLVPDVVTLSRMGGGPKNDVSLDIPEGEGTFLNAREFKYASFFNRIKEQISNHWRPLPEYQRRDPSGNIYGMQSRLTVLSIALDDHGELEHLEVAHSSGIDFLDDEGLRAIRAAAPFVHPPKGLLDDSRHIVFKFAFAVDVSGGGMGGLP